MGYFCPGGSYKNQYPCPAGTFSSATGLMWQSQCLLCPVGYYCPQGCSAPVAAAAGYYIDFPGATSINAQKLCPAGQSCSTPGQSLTFGGTPCPRGKYCPAGTSVPVNCPAGTWSDQQDLYAAS